MLEAARDHGFGDAPPTFDAADRTERDFWLGEGTRQALALYRKAQNLAELPAVRVEPHICDDRLDPRCGKEVTHIDYCAGKGDDQVEVSISARHTIHELPAVYLPGQHEIPLADFVRSMPALNALMSDPRVHAAAAAWWQRRAELGLTDQPKEEISLMHVYVAAYDRGFAVGYDAGLAEADAILEAEQQRRAVA